MGRFASNAKLFGALLALLLALPGLASAQNAVPQVQQNGTMLNAATLACSYSAAFAVNQQETTTCTPNAGQFVYITAIAFDVCTNGTGSATTPTTFTTTNLPGAPTFGFAIAATAEICQHWQIPFATPLKSNAAGTAVTVVSPAAATNNAYQATVFGYSSP
jgi:hypothetical protein